MGFKLNNQAPQTFYSTMPNLPNIDVSIEEDEYIQQLKAHTFELLVRPLYNPASTGGNVSIVDGDSGETVEPITFTEALLHYLSTDVVDSDLTKQIKNLYQQGTKSSLDSQLSFDQFMVLEALSEVGLPYPERGRVIYTPGELKDTAASLLSELNKVSSNKIDQLRTEWFAKLSAYVSQFKLSNFRLVTVKDHHAFEDLQKNMANYLKQNITLPTDTSRHIIQFGDLTVDGHLSVGLFLPHDLNDTPYGFNRLLEHEMSKMERKPNATLFNEPYSIKGIVRPTKVVIVNLEEYTKGHNLQREWQQIVRAFNSTHKIQHIKNKNLQTVETVGRDPQAPSSYEGGDPGIGKGGLRSEKISFLTKKQMSRRELVKRIENIAKKQSTTQPTSNYKKQQKNTFMRPNRRNPDDINAQGKTSSTIYSPDLHIWLDTSGSISKEDYENEIQTIIAIAKHLNVDIFFNSFSHLVSETTKIPTQNKTNRQIFHMVEYIDKVGGGTNFVNVWEAIDKTEIANIRNNQAARIHLVLSDMDYRIPSSYTLQNNRPSVKNTYYLPMRIRNDHDKRNIQDFAMSLERRGGKGLASGHILF